MLMFQEPQGQGEQWKGKRRCRCFRLSQFSHAKSYFQTTPPSEREEESPQKNPVPQPAVPVEVTDSWFEDRKKNERIQRSIQAAPTEGGGASMPAMATNTKMSATPNQPQTPVSAVSQPTNPPAGQQKSQYVGFAFIGQGPVPAGLVKMSG